MTNNINKINKNKLQHKKYNNKYINIYFTFKSVLTANSDSSWFAGA